MPHGAQAVAAKLGREARAGFSALDDCLEICNCGCQKQLARLSERIAERPDTFATLGLMGELEDLARAHGGRRLLAWSESTQELLDTLRGLGILGRLCGWAPG